MKKKVCSWEQGLIFKDTKNYPECTSWNLIGFQMVGTILYVRI